MDNLLGFCFCFTFFARYAMKALVFVLQEYAFKMKTDDIPLVFLCNVSLAGYLGFMLVRKSYLEYYARAKICAIYPVAVVRAIIVHLAMKAQEQGQDLGKEAVKEVGKKAAKKLAEKTAQTVASTISPEQVVFYGLSLYEIIIPIAIGTLMLISHRMRPHY